MSKDVINIIRNRASVRRYSLKKISNKCLDKIIEAGRFGPSVLSYQPWFFCVVKNKDLIKKISSIISYKNKDVGVVERGILNRTVSAIETSAVIILIYNSNQFQEFIEKKLGLGEEYVKISKIAECAAISAAIQNMILVAESLNIGSCWLDTPLLCSKEINELLSIKKELFSMLTFGYSMEKGQRARRKDISQLIKYF